MTTEYRDHELRQAETERDAARLRYDGAKTKSARRVASEDLEFWSSRVANLMQTLM